MEKEKIKDFLLAMSVIRPDFDKFPDWAQQVAYGEYLAQRQEIRENISQKKSEIQVGSWCPAAVDRYVRSARHALRIEHQLQEYPEKLQTREAVKLLLRQMGYFAQEENQRTERYSLDFYGEYTVFTATFDLHGHTTFLLYHKNEVDIQTGKIISKSKKIRNYEKGEKQMKNKYDVSVTPVQLENNNTKAYADVTINDTIKVSGLRIVKGKENLFVAMPSYEKHEKNIDGEKEYQDIVYPRTAEARQELTAAVLSTYYPDGYTEQSVGVKATEMPITARVSPVNDPTREELKGLGTVNIGDFAVTSLQLRKDDQGGLFVNLPFKLQTNRETGEVSYKKVVSLSPEKMRHVRGVVTLTYKQALEQHQEQNQDQVDQKKTETEVRMTDQMAAFKEKAKEKNMQNPQKERKNTEPER